MPLPNIDDRRRKSFDSLLELRDYDDAAVSATTSETGISFEVRMIDNAKVVVDHAAIGGTVDASNYWTVAVEISNVVGGTYTEIATTGALGATAASIELPISGEFADYKDNDAAFIRVTATETGTTAGDLTYGGYISPA